MLYLRKYLKLTNYNKSKLVAEFLADKIKEFDQLLFKKPLPVSICQIHPNDELTVACFNPEKSLLYKLLGFKGEYVIFQNHLEKIYGKEEYLISVAAHEVRHRFQLANRNCLIQQSYLEKNIIIDIETVKFVKDKVSLRKEDPKHYPFEFDASLIQKLIFDLISIKIPQPSEIKTILSITP